MSQSGLNFAKAKLETILANARQGREAFCVFWLYPRFNLLSPFEASSRKICEAGASKRDKQGGLTRFYLNWRPRILNQFRSTIEAPPEIAKSV